MEKTAIVSGTFDPITNGHYELIRKASDIFDNVIVVVCDNAEKKNMFSSEKRLQAVKASVQHLKNVSCDLLGDRTVADYAKEHNGTLVRGIRNGTDADYEIAMAQINRAIADVETIIFPVPKELSFVSSTFVRELIKHKKPFDQYVPKEAVQYLF